MNAFPFDLRLTILYVNVLVGSSCSEREQAREREEDAAHFVEARFYDGSVHI